MIKFLKDLVNGEPAVFVGIVGVALTSWVAIGAPEWAGIVSPIWIAIGAFYTRQQVTPLSHLSPAGQAQAGGD